MAYVLVRAVSRLFSTLWALGRRASARVPTRHARVRTPQRNRIDYTVISDKP